MDRVTSLSGWPTGSKTTRWVMYTVHRIIRKHKAR